MAQISAVIKESKSDAAVQAILQRLNKLHESFSMTTDRTQRVLDRAFGPMPEEKGSSAPRPAPSGAISAVNARLDDLDAIASEQSALLNRLDSLV